MSPSRRGIDTERAQTYGLVAGLLSQPADRGLLDLVARSATPLATTGRFERLWSQLRLAAAASDPDTVAREHLRLFDARQPGGPRVDLRASVYRGSEALQRLRVDRRASGLDGRPSRGDADRLHALCEDMQWLLQAESALAPAQRWQYRFFERHLAPWYAPALADMKAASHTPFHAALAETALAFLDLEALTGAAGPPAH
jgi:TorA maturation chaperone TorD